MKHLKMYEDLTPEIGDYAIWKSNDNLPLEIIKVVDYYSKYYQSITLYKYYKNSDELIEITYRTKENFRNTHFILYISKDLDDCIDMIRKIEDINKYNL